MGGCRARVPDAAAGRCAGTAPAAADSIAIIPHVDCHRRGGHIGARRLHGLRGGQLPAFRQRDGKRRRVNQPADRRGRRSGLGPVTSAAGEDLRVTFVMASVQFRPWTTRGFFLKAASGMAFVANWLVTVPVDAPPQRSKAFGLGLGAGWEWRTRSPVGVQVFGGQYVAALGDLQTDAGRRRTSSAISGRLEPPS